MRGAGQAFEAGSKALSLLVGVASIALAVSVAVTKTPVEDIVRTAGEVLGPAFIVLLFGLVLTALYCWARLRSGPGRTMWLEAGLQAASGITTLALTYTLLGISFGIGSLAHQKLGPDTVQGIIGDLTAQFSMAFLTTVVGLPLSAVLRTLLLVTSARLGATDLNSGSAS